MEVQDDVMEAQEEFVPLNMPMAHFNLF